MMKKYFYSMLAAGMLFATSCSEDELVDVTKGEGEKVTFKVELPGTQSRAINEDGDKVGDGIYADRLVYAMYEEDQNDVLITGFADRDEETKTFTVTVPMAKDIKYDLLFIAYDDENCAFKIDNTTAANNNLKALQLKSVLTANTDQYDAFVGFLDSQGITAEGTTTVPLKRPFAQVNVGTKLQDLEDIKKLKSQVVTSDFKIYNVPNTLNIFTGEVFGSQELSFTAADILTQYGVEEYPNYETIPNLTYEVDGEEKSYYCLAMSYVLAGQTSSTHDADFRFYREDGKQVSSIDVVSMPIQANYRTNVVGTILTQVEQYEITISKMFADQYYEAEPARKVVVSTADDLESVIEAASEPTLVEVDGDITLGTESKAVSRTTSNGYITIPEGVSVTIDLKGHTITGYDNATASFGLINNSPGSVLSIINTSSTEGKITLTAKNDRDWYAYSSVISNQRGTLSVGEGVVIEHTGGTDMAYGIDNLTNGKGTKAVTTINGATIKSSYRAIRQFLNGTQAFNELYVNSGTIEGANKSIWMQDANKSANPGKLVVKSDAVLNGDVYLYVTAGSTEWPVEVSIANSAFADGYTVLSANAPAGYDVKNIDGVWTVTNAESAADFLAAVNNVEDGGTITLESDIIFTEDARTNSSGDWYEGLYYVGDKSFTVDLNGYTICQNGAVNDYLLLFKNEGSKANSITLKNGTIDAGTAAYCAICTSGGSTQQITINLENINVIGNNSNGSVVKVRSGTELNVKAGTKITGNDNYLGIESYASVTNIYDGAEIYQNGTTSYNGCLVGVGGGGTINVYGGYGKGKRGGFIAMTSGGKINVSNGEWIANTDGTIGDNSNLYVLTAQSNSEESGYAGSSYIYVTGGTFRGGMDAWVLHNDPIEEAGLVISGGNFNMNPNGYMADGYIAEYDEKESTWTVMKETSN